jgi:hypothetical protein
MMRKSEKARVLFVLGILLILICVSFSASANALGSGSQLSTFNNQIVVSPPKIVVNSIEYLENNPGVEVMPNNMTLVSENGIIKIADSSGNYSVSVFNTSSQSDEYQYKVVYSSSHQYQRNTTDIFLDSTNGYFNKITNFQGRVTGIYNVSAINVTSSAAIIAAYPVFVTAIVVDQVGSDSSTPPPGGGLSGYYGENSSSKVYVGNQVEEIWLNLTVWFYYNSTTGQPQFVDAWVNMTAESSLYVTVDGVTAAWQDTDGRVWISDNYFYEYYYNIKTCNYSTSVGGDAGIWFYGVYNWHDTDRSPIGYNVWENDTFAYPGFPAAVMLETSVPVKSI